MRQLDQIQENLVSYSLIVAGFVVYLGMCSFGGSRSYKKKERERNVYT